MFYLKHPSERLDVRLNILNPKILNPRRDDLIYGNRKPISHSYCNKMMKKERKNKVIEIKNCTSKPSLTSEYQARLCKAHSKLHLSKSIGRKDYIALKKYTTIYANSNVTTSFLTNLKGKIRSDKIVSFVPLYPRLTDLRNKNQINKNTDK